MWTQQDSPYEGQASASVQPAAAAARARGFLCLVSSPPSLDLQQVTAKSSQLFLKEKNTQQFLNLCVCVCKTAGLPARVPVPDDEKRGGQSSLQSTDVLFLHQATP